MIVNGNGTKWSDDEMILLHALKKANKSYDEISEVLATSIGKREYSSNSCQKKWQNTNWKAFFEMQNRNQMKLDIIENNQEQENEKQRVIDTTLAAHSRLIQREHARTELIIDSVKSSIYRLPKPEKNNLFYTPPKKEPKYTPEHVGVILSDLHIGASYTFEDTGGLSEYNLDVFKKRLNVLKNSVLRISERHRLMYDLPEIHVFCLGDIVAGMSESGEWSPNYINMDIHDQMAHGQAALRDVISTWASAFKKLHFYGIYGNHGRVGRRGQQKVSTNWDRICYNFVQASLSNYDNIEWNIPVAWFIQPTIMNHSFYLTHGDGIKSSMGIPYYGIERAERAVIGLQDDKPDYFLLGHFHSPAEIQTNSGRIIVNGSFMGGDMYSIKDLRRKDRSEQKMFGIHNKKGITWCYNIHLDTDD